MSLSLHLSALRSYRRAGLHCVKALLLGSFVFLSFLLALRPAQAQGSWYAQPCDAQGNLLPNAQHDQNGYYVLTGTQTGTLSNTYPVPMIQAALAYPSLYGDYLFAGSVLGIERLGLPSQTVSIPGTAANPNDRVGAFTPGLGYAYNSGSGGEGSYSIDAAHGGPSSGPVIGSVTGDMSGQLLYYFKMSWSGPGPAPASAPFLVLTYLYAQATGATVTATASDGDPFNETASASSGAGASSGGVPSVQGLHLVQAAVDPTTGVAEVYLNGKAHWVVSCMAPYQTAGDVRSSGGSLVQAETRVDNRSVIITCADIETSYSKGKVDADHPTGQWPHIRNGDGSIQTDSAVTWDDPNLSDYNTPYFNWPSGWDQRYIFSAGSATGATGNLSPTFVWAFTGDGAASYPNQPNWDPPTPPSTDAWPVLNFGSKFGNATGSFGKTSHVRVDVTYADNAVAANTFDVTWHYPVESWKTVGQATSLAPVLYGMLTPDASNTFSYTLSDSTVDYTLPIQAGSLTLTVSGGLVGGLVDGVPGAIIGGFLGAAGYLLDKQSPDPPEHDQITADFTKFTQSLSEQISIDANNASNVGAPTLNRFDPALAKLINSSGNIQAFYNGNGIDANGKSYGTFTVTFEKGRLRFNQVWIGDGYDSNGYSGPYNGSVIYPGMPFDIFVWSQQGMTPPNG